MEFFFLKKLETFLWIFCLFIIFGVHSEYSNFCIPLSGLSLSFEQHVHLHSFGCKICIYVDFLFVLFIIIKRILTLSLDYCIRYTLNLEKRYLFFVIRNFQENVQNNNLSNIGIVSMGYGLYEPTILCIQKMLSSVQNNQQSLRIFLRQIPNCKIGNGNSLLPKICIQVDLYL